MFSLSVRITLVVLAIVFGIYQLSQGEVFGYIWLAAAVLLIVGYFRYGPIRTAFQAMQRGEYKKAQTLIQTIRFPNLLNAQSSAYLHWINAVLVMQDPSDFAKAETEILLAIAGKLRTSNDRCIATALLAYIIHQRGQDKLARSILREADNIPHRDATSQYLQQLEQNFLTSTWASDESKS